MVPDTVRRLRLPACTLMMLLACTTRAVGPGDAAPNFALQDFDGHALRLADFRGKVVLLNFWASWCGPCIEEMPLLSTWQRTYEAPGLQLIGVSMDDEAAPVVKFLSRHPVDYPIVLGDARLGERYGGILGLPQSFLIDRRGLIVARYKGEVKRSQIEAAIESQLRAPR